MLSPIPTTWALRSVHSFSNRVESTPGPAGPVPIGRATNNQFHDTVTVDTIQFKIDSLTQLSIVKTGLSLSNQVAMGTNSSTTNDTFVRPATPMRTNLFHRIVEFFAGGFKQSSVPLEAPVLMPVSIRQQNDQVYIRE